MVLSQTSVRGLIKLSNILFEKGNITECLFYWKILKEYDPANKAKYEETINDIKLTHML